MSYDAGNVATTGFNSSQAYDAYRAIFPAPGKIVMGLEVPPEVRPARPLLPAMLDAPHPLSACRCWISHAPLTNSSCVQAWGGNVLSIADVNTLCSHIKANGGDGLMLWCALQQPAVPTSCLPGACAAHMLTFSCHDKCRSLQKVGTPSAQDISTAACQCLGLGNCTAPL